MSTFSQSLDSLKQLRLYGMSQALEQLIQQPEHHELSLPEGLALLTTQEQHYRENRKRTRLLKQAGLRFAQACPEAVDYHTSRKLNRTQFLELLQCHWIEQAQNIIFLGATGLGKSWLACALGHQACRFGYAVRYFRMSKLLERLRQSHAEGQFARFLNQLSKTRCLILDDWGLDQLTRQQRNDVLEIVEDRYQHGATLIISQLPVKHWHHFIGDNTIADAILDRLLAKAHKISLEGDSMR